MKSVIKTSLLVIFWVLFPPMFFLYVKKWNAWKTPKALILAFLSPMSLIILAMFIYVGCYYY